MSLTPLRAALDWVEVRHPQQPDRDLDSVVDDWIFSWDESDAADPRWAIPIRGERLRSGAWVARGPGLHLHVDQLGLRIQIQGALFARVAAGGEALALDVLRSVLAWAHPSDAVISPGVDPLMSRRSQLRILRLDIAFDLAAAARPGAELVPADEWLARAVWGAGGAGESIHQASDLWSSRAKRNEVVADDAPPQNGLARLHGSRGAVRPHTAPQPHRLPTPNRPGKTLYLGSRDCSQVCVYEKDLAPRTSASTVLALETLRDRCGWDCVSRVIRIEHRLGPGWWRDQVLVRPSGTVHRAQSLDPVELLAMVPRLARESLSRHRHTDVAAVEMRRDRRPSSSIQLAMEALVDRWSDLTGATDVDAVVSARRHATIESLHRSARRSIARLRACTGRSLGDIAADVVREASRLLDAEVLAPDEQREADRLRAVCDRDAELLGPYTRLRDHVSRLELAATLPELARLAVEAHRWMSTNSYERRRTLGRDTETGIGWVRRAYATRAATLAAAAAA